MVCRAVWVDVCVTMTMRAEMTDELWAGMSTGPRSSAVWHGRIECGLFDPLTWCEICVTCTRV